MSSGASTLARKVGIIATATLVVLLIFWWVQQNNVNSLKQQIDWFDQQIKGLPKKELEQQLSVLKQQIEGLPATVVSKKELEQQLSVLEKQIDDLPDKVLLKDQLDLEKDRLILEKDRVNGQNAIYVSLVQALGGIFFFVTAYLSWRNLQATEEKQITERFSKAVEQLGSDKIEVRLGGIYSLERIAIDSAKDHWTIMEILTSFVREKSSLLISHQKKKETLAERYLPKKEKSATQELDLPPVSEDVQAAIIVIGRRDYQKDPREKEKILDLSSTNLTQVYLAGANLEGAYLEKANLKGVHLEKANLKGVHLEKANLTDAHLEGATLTDAHLEGATLTDANFWKACLERTHFNRANLTGADLRGADLNKACFDNAELKGIRSEGAKNLPSDFCRN